MNSVRAGDFIAASEEEVVFWGNKMDVIEFTSEEVWGGKSEYVEYMIHCHDIYICICIHIYVYICYINLL